MSIGADAAPNLHSGAFVGLWCIWMTCCSCLRLKRIIVRICSVFCGNSVMMAGELIGINAVSTHIVLITLGLRYPKQE